MGRTWELGDAGRNRQRRAAGIVILLVAAAVVPALAVADYAVMGGTMPSPRYGTSAVWTGTHAFVFGGMTSDGNGERTVDSIIRFTPSTGISTTMPSTLPTVTDTNPFGSTSTYTGRGHTSAVWASGRAYVFGGASFTPYYLALDHILTYDPGTGAVAERPERLPFRVEATSAVWTGTYAYIFGGLRCDNPCFGGTRSDQVIRYEPATGAVTTLPQRLPLGKMATSAVWTGSVAYLFGGQGGTSREIIRYVPGVGGTVMGAQLPAAASWTAATWDGTYAFIHQGNSCGSSGDACRVWRYDPATDTISTMGAGLGKPGIQLSAVWAGGAAYVFGGSVPSEGRKDILKYDPYHPEAPETLFAARGAGAGEILVTWDAPGHADSITSYKLYRSTTTTGTFSLVASVGGSLRAWTDAGLPAGATRCYKAAAANGFGEGLVSGVSCATTFALPGAPSGLAASRAGPGEIKLAWNAPTTTGGLPLSGYRVYRSDTVSGLVSLVGTTAHSVRAFTDTGLPDSTTRYYRVTATTDAGESPQSNQASARTAGVPLAPRAPVSAAGPARGEIRFSWLMPSDNGGAPITSYLVYRSTTPTGAATVIDVGTALSYTVSGLPDGAFRYVRVAAVNSYGESALAGTVQGQAPRLPSWPQGLQAQTDAPTLSVTLSWQAPSDTGGVPLLGYSVFRSVQGSGTTILAQPTATSYTDSTCPLAKQCSYVVAARNVVGQGPLSISASAVGLMLPVG